MGFDSPSDIQKKALPPFINERKSDIVAQAPSGTGKTGAFGIGVLNNIDTSKSFCQAMILEPTREMAIQTASVIEQMGQYMKPSLSIVRCFGGTSVRDNISDLRGVVHVVVGTPGRVLHLLKKGYIKYRSIHTMVLDEADQMVSRGLGEQVKDILRGLDRDIRIGLFSATMPEDALDIIENFLRNPVKILLEKDQVSLEGIKNYKVYLKNEDKEATLTDIYGHISASQTIIFCRSRRNSENLQEYLEKDGFTVSLIHGSMDQSERTSILSDFRAGSTRILITTDLMARGIDVQQVSLVINYDMPMDLETYMHRVGRSGRYGRKGVAINLVTDLDLRFVRDLEAAYSVVISDLTDAVVESL